MKQKLFNKKLYILGLGLIFSSFIVTSCVKLADNESDTAVVSEESQEIEEESQEIEEESSESEIDEATQAKIDLPFYHLTMVLPDGKGNDVDLSMYEGKLTFVNFFATWCGPCNEEMVLFEKYYNDYKDELNIVLINLNHSSGEGTVEDVYDWYNDGKYTMPMVFDMDGSVTEDYLVYIQGIPTTFVYDSNGEFLFYIPGALNEENMELILSEYIG